MNKLKELLNYREEIRNKYYFALSGNNMNINGNSMTKLDIIYYFAEKYGICVDIFRISKFSKLRPIIYIVYGDKGVAQSDKILVTEYLMNNDFKSTYTLKYIDIKDLIKVLDNLNEQIKKEYQKQVDYVSKPCILKMNTSYQTLEKDLKYIVEKTISDSGLTSEDLEIIPDFKSCAIDSKFIGLNYNDFIPIIMKTIECYKDIFSSVCEIHTGCCDLGPGIYGNHVKVSLGFKFKEPVESKVNNLYKNFIENMNDIYPTNIKKILNYKLNLKN